MQKSRTVSYHEGISFGFCCKIATRSSNIYAISFKPFSGLARWCSFWCSTATGVLLVNIALLIYAATHHSLTSGIAKVRQGACDTSALITINVLSHLGINILSTLLLAASNNCMQCLVAPTRTSIDRAHAGRRWLDIGVHSIRNLKCVGHSL